MLNEVILASKSKVRKEILDNNNIFCLVKASNIDEDVIKESYYEIQTKFEEKFDNAELAAKSDKPSELASIEVLDIKFDKSRIKLNQRTDKDGSKE